MAMIAPTGFALCFFAISRSMRTAISEEAGMTAARAGE
jgi:hypothetical protein